MNEDERRQASESAERDQALAEIAETWPPLLYRFYKRLVAEGFKPDAALLITRDFLTSVVAAGGRSQ